MNLVNIVETCTSAAILALTPRERWGSATNGLNPSDTTIPKWFIICTAVTVLVLIISSVVVVYKQKVHKK